MPLYLENEMGLSLFQISMLQSITAVVAMPLKFYIEAGILEVNSLLALQGGPNLIVSNQHLRDVLQAKGYDVHYAEFAGGHDYLCWQGTLANGLLALIGKNIPTW